MTVEKDRRLDQRITGSVSRALLDDSDRLVGRGEIAPEAAVVTKQGSSLAWPHTRAAWALGGRQAGLQRICYLLGCEAFCGLQAHMLRRLLRTPCPGALEARALGGHEAGARPAHSRCDICCNARLAAALRPTCCGACCGPPCAGTFCGRGVPRGPMGERRDEPPGVDPLLCRTQNIGGRAAGSAASWVGRGIRGYGVDPSSEPSGKSKFRLRTASPASAIQPSRSSISIGLI